MFAVPGPGMIAEHLSTVKVRVSLEKLILKTKNRLSRTAGEELRLDW